MELTKEAARLIWRSATLLRLMDGINTKIDFEKIEEMEQLVLSSPYSLSEAIDNIWGERG
jgi:hypothetical protein